MAWPPGITRLIDVVVVVVVVIDQTVNNGLGDIMSGMRGC